MKAPFPYFGGKSRVAPLVWQRFGDTPNYVEPFAGSLAVLLARENWQGRIETVNDADCMISNFWRAVSADPEAVASHADWPVNEADLHARHHWLVNSESSKIFRERMKFDPDYYDSNIAGWWVWGICQWIGGGWCHRPDYTGRTNAGRAGRGVTAKGWNCRPILSNAGVGIHSKSCQPCTDAFDEPQLLRPCMAGSGKGVHRVSMQLPSLRGDSGASGAGIHASAFNRKTGGIYDYFEALQQRLRQVRVACGDWSRVMGPSVTFKQGITGVFLDPPYSQSERDMLYSHESDCAAEVRQWCIENGDNPLLRIALCGYEGEGHEQLESLGWDCIAWKAGGGYGSTGQARGRDNAHRERIWFSPACLKPSQGALFS